MKGECGLERPCACTEGALCRANHASSLCGSDSHLLSKGSHVIDCRSIQPRFLYLNEARSRRHACLWQACTSAVCALGSTCASRSGRAHSGTAHSGTSGRHRALRDSSRSAGSRVARTDACGSRRCDVSARCAVGFIYNVLTRVGGGTGWRSCQITVGRGESVCEGV